MAQALDFIQQIFGQKGNLPCTLLVVDEIQQFIGEKIQRAMDLQEIAEACSTKLNQRLLLIGTGQSALNTTPSLQRLQARFAVRVQLSDADVESVIRKTVLRKKPEKESAIAKCLSDNQGEIARHLQNTRFAASHEDDKFFVQDYPLLPTRRRFWEKVLRNTDHSGTKAQLRSQLQIVFEATRQTAAATVGTVVPADFIYDQISTDLLNSGELEREYDEIIRKQRDGSKDGDLRSSLRALIFLIGKLPRTPGADDGVRATTKTLVDLLVGDLKTDRPKLEQQAPALLKQLVDAGQLIAVDTEYRLQTREGALWTHDFNRRRTAVLSDDERINSKRVELLREGTKQALKPVSLQQGTSHQPRKLVFELSSSRPASSNDEVTLWVRDGWSDDEKSVLNDARAAGVDSPLLFGYLPRLNHEDLRQAIASHVAAQETLDAHGPAGTPEAIEARKAVETHLEVARHRIQELLGHIMGGAKVFLAGGQEANGVVLADKVQDSANSALERLFQQFGEADHANWGQVVTKARTGDVGALSQVGYQCACEACGQAKAVIGYDVSEQLDVEPAKYFVVVTKREKRACKHCEEGGVAAAPAPARIIEKSLVSDRVVIDTVVAKYSDHLPLYRQSVILQREAGVEIGRATLDGWVMRVGELLIPVAAVIRRELLGGSYIQADEIPVDVQLHDGRGQNHQAYLWQYSRPGGGVVRST